MKTISGIEFASEHNGTDVFRLIELAYEQGRKDGHSDQLEKVVAELKSLLIQDQPAAIPIGVDKDKMEKAVFGYPEKSKKPKAGAHPMAEMIKQMAREGKGLQEIMKAAGCSEPTARKYMKEVQDGNDKTTNNTTNA